MVHLLGTESYSLAFLSPVSDTCCKVRAELDDKNVSLKGRKTNEIPLTFFLPSSKLKSNFSLGLLQQTTLLECQQNVYWHVMFPNAHNPLLYYISESKLDGFQISFTFSFLICYTSGRCCSIFFFPSSVFALSCPVKQLFCCLMNS